MADPVTGEPDPSAYLRQYHDARQLEATHCYIGRRWQDVIGMYPPAAELIKKKAGVAKGSATPHTAKVATLTQAQVREIAEQKLVDLNANDVEAAAKIIAGTARSMGITVQG